VAKLIGADGVIYQKLDALVAAVSKVSAGARASGNGASGNGEGSKDGSGSAGAAYKFDLSCFNGEYITADIDESYFKRLNQLRGVSEV
jgi:glutamine phosphoribosylpyrophosphate amidotransferase